MSDRAELLSVVLASVRGMPSSHVRALAAALASVAGTQAEVRPAVLGAMPNPAYRQHALQLLDAWAKSPGTPAVALGLALESALAIREHEREAETIEVVATGPASRHVSLRHTKAVLLQLVDAARRELIVVTYAAYRVPELSSSLRSARNRGATVRLILETTSDSAGALTHDGIHAFDDLRDDVEVYCWPLDQRPPGARLHAKTAVADGELAFVTSANLTGHALDQNLEVGVLIRGGQAPRRVMEHFHALMAKGVLRRV